MFFGTYIFPVFGESKDLLASGGAINAPLLDPHFYSMDDLNIAMNDALQQKL